MAFRQDQRAALARCCPRRIRTDFRRVCSLSSRVGGDVSITSRCQFLADDGGASLVFDILDRLMELRHARLDV